MSELVVPASDEFRRIASLARRDPSELMTDGMCTGATNALRCAGADGSRVFRPIQAAGLITSARSVELGSPGAFLPIGVGEGKTDITFCLPLVLQSTRAVLTVPGGLTSSRPGVAGKTERDFMALRAHWKESAYGQIISYQRLGRANGGDLLDLYQPDLIVSDEAHSLRNREFAACARVVEDYVRRRRAAGHRVIWIVLSGTMTGGSLLHYAHLAELTLGGRTFLPIDEIDLDFWRRAVDAEVELGGRVAPGALLTMPHERKGTQMQRAQTAVQQRMHETEGVIASTTTDVKASLNFNLYGPEVGDEAGVPEATWYALRDDWRLPNGEQCLDGFEIHRHAREFACGYVSEWDPPPPDDWRKARKAYAKQVRTAVGDRRCNTEVEFRALCDTLEGEEGEELRAIRDAWLEIRPAYNPDDHRVARWLSTATLEACASWAKRHKSGIIWTSHVPFGERLERDFGIKHFGEEGLAQDGEYIEDARGVISASVQANFQGRNLQFKWADNLIVSPFGSAERSEQTFGRTHRSQQPADAVNVDFLIVCVEHVNALRRACARAATIQRLMRNPQKLVFGTWVFEIEALAAAGRMSGKSRWVTKIEDEDDDEEDRLMQLIEAT